MSKKRGSVAKLLFLIIFVGIIVFGVLFYRGSFGLKDFGIKTSEEAYKNVIAKLSFTKDLSPSSGDYEDYEYIYGEPIAVDTNLTSEELTSFFNFNRPEYYALKNVQIRINSDNTVDVSATLDTNYIIDTVLAGRYSEQEIKKALPFMSIIPDNVNIYAQLSGEVKDNKSMNIAFNDIEVMGIGVPSSIYDTASAKSEIKSILDNFISKTTEKTKGTIESLKIENGQLTIKGNIPSSLTRKEVK